MKTKCIMAEPISLDEIQLTEPIYFDDMVKGVVDIKKEIVALHAEMHSDLEQLLLDNGSNQKDLFGFNIYFDDGELEVDSNINPPRNAELGFPRAGRLVTEPNTVAKIESIVFRMVLKDE